MRALVLLLLSGLLLGAAPAALPPNLVLNASFERDGDGDGTPDGWGREFLTAQDVLVADPFHGSRSFLIVGDPARPKHLIQVLGPGTAGQQFRVTGTSKAENPSATGGLYAAGIHIYYTDGTESSILAYFNPTTHDWQRARASGTLQKDATKVVFGILYANQTGRAWFDVVGASSP